VRLIQAVIPNLFTRFGLDSSFLVGQCYDGASVMSGRVGGVQQKLKEYIGQNAFVPYVHCPAHQLNLVIMHAAEHDADISVKNFFGGLQSIYVFFASSHLRWNKLRDMSTSQIIQLEKEVDDEELEEIEIDEVVEDSLDMSTSSVAPQSTVKSSSPSPTLKSLCGTRWAYRYYSADAVQKNFFRIRECLEDWLEEGDLSSDDSFRCATVLNTLNWTFYVDVCWWHEVLLTCHAASQILQKVDCDLSIVVAALRTLIDRLKSLRHEDVHQRFVDEANRAWNENDIDSPGFPVQRARRKKRMDGELQRDDVPDAQTVHRRAYL
jgi:hypothetical protein